MIHDVAVTLPLSGNDHAGVQYTKHLLWKFYTNFEGDLYNSTYASFTNLSRLEVIQKTVGMLNLRFGGTSRIIHVVSTVAYIIGEDWLVEIHTGNLMNELDEPSPVHQRVQFNAYGLVATVLAITDCLAHTFPVIVNRMPVVSWELVIDGKRVSRNIGIARPKPAYQEFYPWLDEPVMDYMQRFLTGEDAVLILLGETGTGKTSFIRRMIWEHLLRVKITYDQELLSTDHLFFDFLTDTTIDMLVIEDADLLLSDREHAGNKTMSRFLNMTDGLIKPTSNKKIIFTANILEPSTIDSALLREGRCFDCQVFRRLTYEEACAAAQVSGIQKPASGKTYTMAELFNQRKRRSVTPMGFHPIRR